jgi:hypothetical protein
MGDDELQALADDIREHGLRQPIVRDREGRIVDGRNRAHACDLAGVDAEFVTVDADDPLALVVSLNVKRRNLTAGQRAIAAAKAWDMVGKVPTEAKRRDVLAAMFGVNEKYVQQARALVHHVPDVAAAVGRGEVDLRGSYDAYREERERLDAIEAERRELRGRLEDLSRELAEVDFLAPPAADDLQPVAADIVKQSVAQSLPKTSLVEPSAELRRWDEVLKTASDVATAVRQMPAYPADADDLLGLTVHSVARALGDAASRLLTAIPDTQPTMRRVK